MERRDILKIATGSAVAMAAGSAATTSANAQQTNVRAKGIGVKDIAPTPADYFLSDRFKGKTLIVTGCARGMGAAAAVRAAREEAQRRSKGSKTLEARRHLYTETSPRQAFVSGWSRLQSTLSGDLI